MSAYDPDRVLTVWQSLDGAYHAARSCSSSRRRNMRPATATVRDLQALRRERGRNAVCRCLYLPRKEVTE